MAPGARSVSVGYKAIVTYVVDGRLRTMVVAGGTRANGRRSGTIFPDKKSAIAAAERHILLFEAAKISRRNNA